MLKIKKNTLSSQDVIELLEEHLQDMRDTSPPESIHALDIEALQQGDIEFFTAYDKTNLAGCVALKKLNHKDGEIKSMRTSNKYRGVGIGKELVNFIVNHAKTKGLNTLYLETGTQPFFKPARRLYKQCGFTECLPFANYKLDENSCFMKLVL